MISIKRTINPVYGQSNDLPQLSPYGMYNNDDVLTRIELLSYIEIIIKTGEIPISYIYFFVMPSILEEPQSPNKIDLKKQ